MGTKYFSKISNHSFDSQKHIILQSWGKRPAEVYLHVINVEKTGNVSDLLNKLIVHLECPQLQAGRQLSDGGKGEKELFRAAQGNIRVDQLSLLDLLLLLLCGDHC